MVSCLSVSLKPRANTDTQVAFPGSWLVKFRNKREKDRRKKEEKEKKIRSQDVKHRCLKSRKVFSLSRLCPDAVFIFNEYRYAEKEKREGWGPLSIFIQRGPWPLVNQQELCVSRSHCANILATSRLIFFLRAFYWRILGYTNPSSNRRGSMFEFFNKENSSSSLFCRNDCCIGCLFHEIIYFKK